MVAIGYTSGDERKLDKAGGTMTGPLVLPNDPAADMQAATKHYVDTAITGGVDIDAGDITSGTLDVARVPTGTTSGTVAIGNDSRITGAAQKASNLSDLANASTSRNNLGLGTAATMNVGTAVGTVAAGDDARFAGTTVTAVKTANYTAAANEFVPVDTTSGNVTITLPAAPADKTQVGVKHVVRGGTNTVTVTRAGSDVFNVAGGATSLALTLVNQGVALTYKASSSIWYATSVDLPLSGLDSRFLQLGNNLSDLANAGTARTNLGLGGAAVLAVGTAAGTVAAGNDSRFTDTRTPTDGTVTDAKIGGSKLSPASLTLATFTPADHGFLTWSIDPALAGTGQALNAAGQMAVTKVKLPVAATISTICLFVTTAIAGGSNCFAALYDSSGTRQGVTANLTTAWGTTGYAEHALTGAYVAAAGTYYVTLLAGAASTLPAFSRNAQSIAVNAGLSAPGLRFGVVGSSLTAAPSSITLSSVTAATSATSASFFVALK